MSTILVHTFGHLIMERTCFLRSGVSHIYISSYISNMIKGITAGGPHLVKLQVLSIQFGYVECHVQTGEL